MGLEFGAFHLNVEALRGWKTGVINQLADGLEQLAKQYKVKVVRARAAFDSPSSLKLVYPDSKANEILPFENLLLASGSIPIIPDVFGRGHPDVWDSSDALALPEIPESLLVIGGGHIGLELGSVYASFGSKVTVVEMSAGLLPQADRDLVVPLSRRLKTVFHEIHLHSRVVKVEDAGPDGLKAVVDNIRTGERHSAVYSKVLVAVGRRPYVDHLDLEKAGIKTAIGGFIQTDMQAQTSAPHIYAVGDVAGNPMLAHKAIHESRHFAMRFCGQPMPPVSRYIPSVSFTNPEVAWCGLTETTAKQSGQRAAAAKSYWAANGRALATGRADGFTKIIFDPDTDRLLGVGIVGNGACELIAEAAMALETGTTVAELARAIHPHPTLSEALTDTALKAIMTAHKRKAKAQD